MVALRAIVVDQDQPTVIGDRGTVIDHLIGNGLWLGKWLRLRFWNIFGIRSCAGSLLSAMGEVVSILDPPEIASLIPFGRIHCGTAAESLDIRCQN